MNDSLDIYISHFNYGNTPAQKEQMQWIQNFSMLFNFSLNRILKRKTNILTTAYFKLNEEDFEDISITENANNFIIIITPEYLNSKECTEEFHSITENIKLSKNKNIFLALSAPIDQKNLKEDLYHFPHYEFFGYNAEDKKIITYNLEKIYEKKFWNKLNDLCYDVSECFNKKSKYVDKKCIFIAETSIDQIENRDVLRRELKRLGLTVLPEQPLPKDTEKINEIMQNLLPACVFSIHIFGEKRGEILNGGDTSNIELEYQIASNYSKIAALANNKFFRYIWIPPELEFHDEKQLIRIEQLKRDNKNLMDSQVIQAPIEIFKTELYQNYISKDSENNKNSHENSDSQKKKIYLICEYQKHAEVTKLGEWLTKKGFDVIFTSTDISKKEVIQTHKQQLIKSDAVLIYYHSQDNPAWFKTKLQELIKSPGFGKKKPFDAKAVYIKDKLNLEHFEMLDDFEIIENPEPSKPELLDPFIEKIKNNGQL